MINIPQSTHIVIILWSAFSSVFSSLTTDQLSLDKCRNTPCRGFEECEKAGCHYGCRVAEGRVSFNFGKTAGITNMLIPMHYSAPNRQPIGRLVYFSVFTKGSSTVLYILGHVYWNLWIEICESWSHPLLTHPAIVTLLARFNWGESDKFEFASKGSAGIALAIHRQANGRCCRKRIPEPNKLWYFFAFNQACRKQEGKRRIEIMRYKIFARLILYKTISLLAFIRVH